MKSEAKQSKILIILLLVPMLISPMLAASATGATGLKTEVLYIGVSGGNVLDALELDKETIEVTVQDKTSISFAAIDDFDVIVLNDVNLSSSQLTTLESWAQVDGHGVMVIMGPNLNMGTQVLSTLNVTTETQFSNNTGKLEKDEELGEYKGLSVVNEDLGTSYSPILSIVWNTAPETFYFSKIGNLEEDVTTYVAMQWMGNLSTSDGYPIICATKLGDNAGDNVFVFSGWFQEEYDTINSNEHFMIWPFFNYLMFITAQASSGESVPEYGQWQYSPVPHLADQIGLGIFVLIVAVASILLYVRVRRKKKEHREVFATSDLKSLQKTASTSELEEIKESDSQLKEVIDEEILEEKVYVDGKDDWESIGFHRQISGFLKLFFVMILLLIPQLLLTSIVMPRFLNPYPQANGWYSYTLRFFEAIWLVFDMGFNFALVKYFSQHRIENPEKAYHYVQLFVWWEILSGVVQVFIIAFMGSIIFPMTNFSYLSWMFIAHSLIQFPGFFLVFQYFFQGMQRADYHMIAFALQYFVLRLVLQLVTVPIFKAIYASQVMYGPAFGAGIGLLIGQLLGDVVLLFITWKLYNGLSLPTNPIFLADFTKEEFIETIKFGGKMILGQVWVPLVWLLQVYLVGVFLPNSSAEQGYFELAFTISTIPQAVSLLMHSMMGGLTEAHEYDKKHLLNYTSFSGIKWGSIWTFYLCATFWAIGSEFIIGASGPNWARAAALIPYLMIYRGLGPLSWQMDFEFAAADKPLYAGIAWIIEQSIRAVLLYVFLSTMAVMEAVVFAYIAAIASKDIVVLILVRRKIHKWDWNIWQSFIAPLLAAVVVYFMQRLMVFVFVDTLMGTGILSAMILFVLGLFVFEHVYSFFLGLAGGYDENTLAELERASNMVTGVGFFARLYYKSAEAGAKVSPLHNRFPVKNYELVEREAQEITDIKKKIVID